MELSPTEVRAEAELLETAHGVLADHLLLVARQRPCLVQQCLGDETLAHVVQQRALGNFHQSLVVLDAQGLGQDNARGAYVGDVRERAIVVRHQRQQVIEDVRSLADQGYHVPREFGADVHRAVNVSFFQCGGKDGARGVLENAVALVGRNRFVGQHVTPHVLAVLFGLRGQRVESGNALIQQPGEVVRFQRNVFFPVKAGWPASRRPKIQVKGNLGLRLQGLDRHRHQPSRTDRQIRAAIQKVFRMVILGEIGARGHACSTLFHGTPRCAAS